MISRPEEHLAGAGHPRAFMTASCPRRHESVAPPDGGAWLLLSELLALLAVGHVNGMTFYRQSSFVHGFRHGRVRVAGQCQVFGAGAELHGDHALGDHLTGVLTHDVHAEDTVSFRIGNDLGAAFGGVSGAFRSPWWSNFKKSFLRIQEGGDI